MATRAHPPLLNAAGRASPPSPALLGGIVAAALVSGALVFLLVGSPALALGFVAGAVAVGGLFLFSRTDAAATPIETPVQDWALTRAAIDSEAAPIAITDRQGRLV